MTTIVHGSHRVKKKTTKNRFNQNIQFEINTEASGLDFDILKGTKLAQLNLHVLNIDYACWVLCMMEYLF